MKELKELYETYKNQADELSRNTYRWDDTNKPAYHEILNHILLLDIIAELRVLNKNNGTSIVEPKEKEGTTEKENIKEKVKLGK